MINFISSSFRTIISITAWIALVAAIVLGIAVAGSVNVLAGILVFGGAVLFIVMLYGTICLLIQNNELLKRIAERPAA